MLGNAPNEPTKFRTKNWIEINDGARGTFNTKSQIKFKTSMIQSSICDYSDAYMLVSGTITVNELAAYGGNNNIQVVFENCTPFTDCISKINNTQIDNANGIDVVMPIYGLIEYKDNYSKTSGSLWEYYRDEPTLTNAGAPNNFPGNGASFKYKQKIIGSKGNNGTKAVKIMVPLKYLSIFWRTFEMLFINCEINLILMWSANCAISNAAANQATTFTITDRRLYIPVVTL